MARHNLYKAEDVDRGLEVQRYLPASFRNGIEQQYYDEVSFRARFDMFSRDPDFLRAPSTHLALYSDHGRVHVRDVAKQILHVLDVVNGLLISERQSNRLEFMRGYGLILAYLHDIGMASGSKIGRTMHPEFAAQEVFRPEFDMWIDRLWEDNCGQISWRLTNLVQNGLLDADPKLVLREMISMSCAHSKSKVPAEYLDDPSRLKRTMQLSLGMDLDALYCLQQCESRRAGSSTSQESRDSAQAGDCEAVMERLRAKFGDAAAAPSLLTTPNTVAMGRYEDFERESFEWLTSEREPMRALVHDVIDSIRALRCADALRQRGTVLRTSAGYPIFVDRQNAKAVYAIPCEGRRTVLLEIESIHGAGEANMATCELTPEGDIRIVFHRGSFSSAETVQRAVRSAAVIVNDVQMDTIDSFRGAAVGADPPPRKTADEMRIFIETVDDNVDFAELVCEELIRINSRLETRTRVVPSLEGISKLERINYQNADEVNWDLDRRRAILTEMAARGHKSEKIDPDTAFIDVRFFEFREGDIVVEADTRAGIVYIPLADGLAGRPLGGFADFELPAMVPFGHFGVIRGGVRSATIVAKKDTEVLMIPKDVYLRHWHGSYSLDEFTDMLAKGQLLQQE